MRLYVSNRLWDELCFYGLGLTAVIGLLFLIFYSGRILDDRCFGS